MVSCGTGTLQGWDAAGPGATGLVGVSVSGGSVPGVARARSVALAFGRRWTRRPLRDWRPDPSGGGYRNAEGTADTGRSPVSLVGPRSGRPPSPGAAPSRLCSRSRLGMCVWERWPLFHNGKVTAVLFACSDLKLFWYSPQERSVGWEK